MISCIQSITLILIASLCIEVVAQINRKNSHSAIIFQNGRNNSQFRSPRCCQDRQCIQRKSLNRFAILTTFRSDDYLPVVRNFICSVYKTNPQIELIIATVPGDISQASIDFITAIRPPIKLIYWENVNITNSFRKRFGLNWVKLRAWGMTDYDALLLVDVDTLIVRDISHLSEIPAHFAAVLDEDKPTVRAPVNGLLQGGVIFLRPCLAVLEHMLHILQNNDDLHFSLDHAEQTFLDWYFRFERWALPTTFNAIHHRLDQNLLTRGGIKPHIIHYTRKNLLNAWSTISLEESWNILRKNGNLCAKLNIDIRTYLT